MSDPKGKGKATGVDLNDPILSSMVDATGKPIAPVVLKDFKEVGDKDLEALVKSITDDEVNKIIKAVEGITEKDMTALEFSIFDFVGFDPFMVSKVLAFYQKHYNDTQENLLSDIRFSIAACLYMGNLQYKSLSRRALEGRSKIEYLARKYGIRTGSHGTGIPATALTFPYCSSISCISCKNGCQTSSQDCQSGFQICSCPTLHPVNILRFTLFCYHAPGSSSLSVRSLQLLWCRHGHCI